MLGFIRFVKNFFLHNRRLAEDKVIQEKDGYSLEFSSFGPERYVTYLEKGREIDVLADFTLLNDVVLYADSLKRWSIPRGEVLTPFEYQKSSIE